MIPMNESIIVAILSLCGTAIGGVVSVMTANRLAMYKIEQLQKEVEKHNQVITRVYELEKHAAVMDERITVLEGKQ